MSSAASDEENESTTQNGTDNSETSNAEEEGEICELNHQLDDLNSVLDLIEEKNDNIQARLAELLKNVQNERIERNNMEVEESDKAESDR